MTWYNVDNMNVLSQQRIPWNKGLTGMKYPNRKSPVPFTEEHKRKIGAYWAGRSRPLSTRLKMSASQKGKIHTAEAREKNRIAHLGNHHTAEAKKRIGDAERGENNNFWKGGKMQFYSESEQIRKSIEYKLWRDACFARDGYSCQKTGIKTNLIVHHICNFADYPDLRVAIDNGITFCEETHKAFHKRYGKNFTTREQLEEFLNDKTV